MDRASPEARRAYGAVGKAVELGELPRASDQDCVACGATATLYHHPHGYVGENAVNVVPMCDSCHREVHQPPMDAMKLLVAYAKKVVHARQKAAERRQKLHADGVCKPRNKLDQDKADEIRQLYATGDYTQKQLAVRAGVSISAISLVLSNRRWAVLP
jgi:hypothetical protein